MITAFLDYPPLRLLNLPGAKPIYDEVLVEDCYRKEQVPADSIVMDVGGFYGEFGIWCAKHRNSTVFLYEPSPMVAVARCNALINDAGIFVFNAAIGRANGTRDFYFNPDHPAGSSMVVFPCSPKLPATSVTCLTLKEQIAEARKLASKAPLCVKLDCEGAEREIFEDESWIDGASLIMLEFHNQDGPHYRDILSRHGFALQSTDDNPQAHRAIIYAQRT